MSATPIPMRHMGITRVCLIGAIRRWGAIAVLPTWEGTEWEGTDEEALASIEADPREVFSPCERTHSDGSCACGDEVIK